MDRSAFWRSEYERVQCALKVSENQCVNLRLDLEAMKAKLESAKPCSPAKKRKKADEDVIPVPRSPKKAKKDISPAKRGAPSSDASDDFDFANLGEIGTFDQRCNYPTTP